ncbi:MAG: hypothetical protein IPN33_24290 [Saprospiraceae bacterium]|nr:hypothetical protein [Saprospiraceae bacterium]
MTKTTLLTFWIIWLLDVLLFLFGYREFIQGVFGRYAGPTAKYIWPWVGILIVGLVIICGSLYLKKHGHPGMAIKVAAIPLVLALPYVLWIAMIVLMGRGTNWR